MRIGYVGNFDPSHSTENHIASTLEAMGYEVERLQEIGPRAVTADHVIERLPWLGLLIWTRTPPGLSGDKYRMLAAARKWRIPTVAYHLDLYAGLPRSADIDREPWWKCDFVFTADGGSDAFFQEHDVNHVWMPPAVYGPEAVLHPGTYVDATDKDGPRFIRQRPYRYDVIFTGQRNYHPEWPYRPQLVDFLTNHYGPRFRRFPMPGEHAVRGMALNQLYAESKVVVGDSLCLGFTHSRYWSDRVPEVTGRGGFLIMPRIAGLDEFYADKVEIVYYDFGDFMGLASLIDYYLFAEDEREAIRHAGYAATLRHSTYRHRMESMIQYLMKANAWKHA